MKNPTDGLFRSYQLESTGELRSYEVRKKYEL